MQELFEWMEYIEDTRQQTKVRHTLKDILVIVLFATLANADDWVEMALFAENCQDYLRKYIELKNGIPSHDTIRCVMGMISPEILLIDKMAAQNLNIIRKWSLSILKPAELSRHKLSMRKKRFVVSLRPIKYLEELLEA
jgi:hypothetical protein